MRGEAMLSILFTSKILPQIHSRVQACDLLRVAVERLRRDTVSEQTETVAGNAAFGFLAPARMVHFGIHVRVKPILLGTGLIPGGLRLGFGKFDFYDRLDAL